MRRSQHMDDMVNALLAGYRRLDGEAVLQQVSSVRAQSVQCSVPWYAPLTHSPGDALVDTRETWLEQRFRATDRNSELTV